MPVAIGDDQVLELGRILETPAQANRALVEDAVHATDRSREVLQLKRLHHLGDADVRRLELVRVDFDRQLALDLAEDLHVSHAGKGAQLSRDTRIGEASQLRRR